MKASNLKKVVINATAITTFNNTNELLMTSCVLYKFLQSLLEYNSSEVYNLKETAKSYVSSYRSTITDMNGTYICYRVMDNLITNSGYTSFLSFSESLINEVYNAYTDKTKIDPFSAANFTLAMYQIRNASWKDRQRLRNIHFNTMVPIAKYYHTRYGIGFSKLQIYNAAGIEDNLGKEILFTISGVTNSKIVGDISAGRTGAEYYSVSINDNYVQIITN